MTVLVQAAQAAVRDLRPGFYVAVSSVNSFLSGKAPFLRLRPSTDWVRPTNTMEGSVRYSKSNDLNDIHICNTFAATSQLEFDHTTGHHDPAKLTRHIDHHTPPLDSRG